MGETPYQGTISVLLVDDDESVLKMTRRLLERRGHDIVACTSGEQALIALNLRTFDVMLTDVHMPKITGVSLLRAVRERDLDLPVVLITGSPDVKTAAAAIEYGACQYLVKPVAQDRLNQVILRAANAARMARIQREYVEQYGSGVMRVGDRAGLDVRLDRALASLWVAYQPIVSSSTGGVFAYEALLRSAEPALPDPGSMLDAAERADRLYDVGRAVRARVAADAETAPPDCTFFVNVHPKDLLDPDLFSSAAALSRLASRVVLEVTERASLDGLSGLRERTVALRQMGFRLALDDLGSGYAGLTSFVRLEPEFVKLDMSLVRNIHDNAAQQKIVGSMVSLCHEMNKQIIAEGIEVVAERDVVARLGCDLLQGYYLAKPGRPWPTIQEPLLGVG